MKYLFREERQESQDREGKKRRGESQDGKCQQAALVPDVRETAAQLLMNPPWRWYSRALANCSGVALSPNTD